LESKPSTFSVEIKAIFRLAERTCHRPIATVSFNGILRFMFLLSCCTNAVLVAKSKRATANPTVHTTVFETPQCVPTSRTGLHTQIEPHNLQSRNIHQVPRFNQALNPTILSTGMLVSPLTLSRAHVRSLPLRTSPKQFIISTKHQGTRKCITSTYIRFINISR
jgi:hypothetical protein